MKQLSQQCNAFFSSSGVDRIALLTSDGDFVSTILKLKDINSVNVVMFIPAQKPGVIRKYRKDGLEVVKILSKDPGPRVRAILHGDGTGSAQLEDPFWPEDGYYEREVEMLSGFLTDLG